MIPYHLSDDVNCTSYFNDFQYVGNVWPEDSDDSEDSEDEDADPDHIKSGLPPKSQIKKKVDDPYHINSGLPPNAQVKKEVDDPYHINSGLPPNARIKEEYALTLRLSGDLKLF